MDPEQHPHKVLDSGRQELDQTGKTMLSSLQALVRCSAQPEDG